MREQDHRRGERVAKVIARAGLASRREAETWIAAGRVAVNGAVIRSPAISVTAHDGITVDGQALPRRERTRLFLFHKARGILTSHGDPRGRPTLFDILPKNLPRLISVGRLDLNSEGLLLLTNDGGLARVLELPATGWLRRYRVRAHGRIAQNYGPVEATVDRAQGSNVWLTFAIREGKNREVRKVLGHLGLAVNRLIRISFGPFQLGDLAPGEIAEVKTRMLREQLGARIAALAGADFSAPVERVIAPTQPRLARVAQTSAQGGRAQRGRARAVTANSASEPASHNPPPDHRSPYPDGGKRRSGRRRPSPARGRPIRARR